MPEASCTAEVIWDLMRGLGVELTQPIAEALYVGLVTDTGKFMYENTGSRAHVMAAELIGAGIDVHAIYRRLYEGVPQGKLELLARGLSAVERFDGGLLTVTQLTREDYAVTGADESYSEGVVDHLRSVEGTAVAGLVRELLSDTRGDAPQGLAARDRRPRRRLARSRARSAAAGTGARPGFSTDLEFAELVAFLRAAARRAALTSTDDGVLLVDKPAGVTSHDVVAAERRQLGARREGRPRRHARPVRDRAAAGADRPRDARAALPDGAAEALRDGRAAGLDVDHRRRRGRDRARAHAGRAARAADRAGSASARRRTPRCGSAAGAPTRWRARARRSSCPSARSTCTRFELLWRDGERAAFAIECGSGTYVRSLIADLGDAYCLELRRTGIGPFDVADAGRFVAARTTRSASCPAVELAGEDARAAGHGVAVPPRRRAGDGGRRTVRLRRRRRPDRARRAARRTARSSPS